MRYDPHLSPDAAAADSAIVTEGVRLAIGYLRRELGEGELVPLRLVRARLAFPRASVDAALLGLEKKREISMRVAQSPASLSPADRDAGIFREGRGLLTWVLL